MGGCILKHTVMKALHEMNNVDKGYLLAQLFPQEMENIVAALQRKCEFLKTNEAKIKETWDNGFISFDMWQSLANHIEGTIKTYKNNLHRSPRVFSDQLFDGYLAIFTNDCIVKYAAAGSKNPKFSIAVALLFNP
jgi:hypothetical protein